MAYAASGPSNGAGQQQAGKPCSGLPTSSGSNSSPSRIGFDPLGLGLWGVGGGGEEELGQHKCRAGISLSLCTKHNKNIFRRKCSCYQML